MDLGLNSVDFGVKIVILILSEAARRTVLRSLSRTWWHESLSRWQRMLIYAASLVLAVIVRVFSPSFWPIVLWAIPDMLLISLAYRTGAKGRTRGVAIVFGVSAAAEILTSGVLSGMARNIVYAVLRCFVPVGILALFAFWEMYRRSLEIRSENAELRCRMEVFESRIASDLDKNERLMELRHDMKHHVNALRYLADQSDSDGVRRYLEGMDEKLFLSEKTVDSGVPAIDGVLSYMAEQARTKGIEPVIHVTVPRELKLSDFDMNVLIGNLMQNAIEAAENSDAKILRVSARYDDGALIILISNSRRGESLRRDGRFLTTKSEEGHGYGLRSAETVVKKYDGSMFFEETEDFFTVKVILFGLQDEK